MGSNRGSFMSVMHSSNNGGSSSKAGANMRQFGHIARKLLGEVPRTLHRTVCHHHRVDTRERPNDNPERRNWSTLGPAKIPAVECENAFLTSNLHKTAPDSRVMQKPLSMNPTALSSRLLCAGTRNASPEQTCCSIQSRNLRIWRHMSI